MGQQTKERGTQGMNMKVGVGFMYFVGVAFSASLPLVHVVLWRALDDILILERIILTNGHAAVLVLPFLFLPLFFVFLRFLSPQQSCWRLGGWGWEGVWFGCTQPLKLYSFPFLFVYCL